MLFSEFMEGTGCKNNDHNRDVYKALESIYMDRDDITKETIYKAGKLLVDNSPSEEEIRTRNQIIDQYNELVEDAKNWEDQATSAKYYAMLYRESDFDYSRIQAEDAKRYKGYARQAREDARRYKQMFPEVFGR